MTLALVLAAGLAAGYALGRYRPLYRAQDWSTWEVWGGRVQTRRKALLALALNPRETVGGVVRYLRGERSGQARPTAQKSPAPTLSPEWADKGEGGRT